MDKDEESYPFGFGTPGDIASAATFLLADTSKWITGSEMILDGGFTLK
jgi:NAD(P)-dependent dehydrogenase (short-subunit alcohol dehydrogenase family)